MGLIPTKKSLAQVEQISASAFCRCVRVCVLLIMMMRVCLCVCRLGFSYGWMACPCLSSCGSTTNSTPPTHIQCHRQAAAPRGDGAHQDGRDAQGGRHLHRAGALRRRPTCCWSIDPSLALLLLDVLLVHGPISRAFFAGVSPTPPPTNASLALFLLLESESHPPTHPPTNASLAPLLLESKSHPPTHPILINENAGPRPCRSQCRDGPGLPRDAQPGRLPHLGRRLQDQARRDEVQRQARRL